MCVYKPRYLYMRVSRGRSYPFRKGYAYQKSSRRYVYFKFKNDQEKLLYAEGEIWHFIHMLRFLCRNGPEADGVGLSGEGFDVDVHSRGMVPVSLLEEETQLRESA